MQAKQSPLFLKSYELLRWLIPATLKFPREQRFVLASHLQKTAFAFQDALFEATLVNPPKKELKRADNLLRRLKLYWRLGFDLKLMPFKRYQHGSQLMDEIGRLLGGWLNAL